MTYGFEFFLHHFTGSLRIEPSDDLCVEEEGCGYVVTQRTQRKRKGREGSLRPLRQNSLKTLAGKTLAGLMHARGISVTAMRGFQTCGRDVNALTGFMPGISSSITPDAANVTTGRATVQAVQKAVIDFLLLFMMFSISRVSGHKNAAFAKDLHTDGSA